MDSVTLRKTHFKLGDYKNNYQTANMDQSKDVFSATGPNPLDEALKNDLRKSHFILGNFDPNYVSTNQREFFDKSKINPNSRADSEKIERALRKHNYVLGDDKLDYKSETADKFQFPVYDYRQRQEQKVSTEQLQQSHYVFGTNNDPWVTTQQRDFGPKKVDQKYYTKNLTRTNFILGNDAPKMKSVAMETYVKHPITSNPINKELANDLRRHHFNFGNEDYGNELISVNNIDYQNPALRKNASMPNITKLNPQFLRESHWSFGTDNGKDHFQTTYDKDMVAKKPIENKKVDNSTFVSSFTINGKGPISYATESRSQFVPMSNLINPNEKKIVEKVIKDNKNSHFVLGNMKNDYGTTSHNAYQFDRKRAESARGAMESGLLNDLRSTHYKLGYMPNDNITTNQATYVDHKDYKFAKAKDPNFQKDNFSFVSYGSSAIQDGKTIYMTDYVKKPLPKEEDYEY